jgi:uridine kinase
MSAERIALLSRLAEDIAGIELEHPVRVAVDGVDGAGKTTLADELVPFIEMRGRAVIRASIDAFDKPKAERYARGPDSPEGFYFDSFDNDAVRRLLLEPLGPNGNRRYRSAAFDWRTDTVVEEREREAAADAILLFDGVFSQRPELVVNWDLCIFLDVRFETTLQRTLKAEWTSTSSAEEKQRRFWARYAAGQKIYLDSMQPKERAQIVMDNNDASKPKLLRTFLPT